MGTNNDLSGEINPSNLVQWITRIRNALVGGITAADANGVPNDTDSPSADLGSITSPFRNIFVGDSIRIGSAEINAAFLSTLSRGAVIIPNPAASLATGVTYNARDILPNVGSAFVIGLGACGSSDTDTSEAARIDAASSAISSVRSVASLNGLCGGFTMGIATFTADSEIRIAAAGTGFVAGNAQNRVWTSQNSIATAGSGIPAENSRIGNLEINGGQGASIQAVFNISGFPPTSNLRILSRSAIPSIAEPPAATSAVRYDTFLGSEAIESNSTPFKTLDGGGFAAIFPFTPLMQG